MSEENEIAESSGGNGSDPVVIGAAMSRSSPDVDAALVAYLAEQRHHLNAQFSPQMRQLHLGVWEKSLGVLLRVATAFTGLVIAAGLAFLVWDAAHSNELRIQSFSVPPDLVRDGLTGNVLAAKLLDDLTEMQAQTQTVRALKSYANSWSQEDIKLDIPETGVSLSEMDSFLRSKLGHDTHISGELLRTTSGFSLTVRVGAEGAITVTGTQTGLDDLIQKSAEAAYRLTQPYRYGVYLAGVGRSEDADAVYQALATAGPVRERDWGYVGWAIRIAGRDGVDKGMVLLERAVAIAPENPAIYRSLAGFQIEKSRPEIAVNSARKGLSLLSGPGREMINPQAIPSMQGNFRFVINSETGAFVEAAHNMSEAEPFRVGWVYTPAVGTAVAQAGAHDLAAARDALKPDQSNPAPQVEALSRGIPGFGPIWARILIANAAEDWGAFSSESKNLDDLFPTVPGARSLLPTTATPIFAFAEAKLGRMSQAEARIADTPGDCNLCLRVRARIAELRGQQARADYWFGRAVHDAPSIPFAYHDWGRALLARGQPEAAIEKFKQANDKGPHFADPLEGWGEALMAKNQSHLALAKFAEAEKYAPDWGRLHLKWGEALVYAGEAGEAKKHFAIAVGLDLVAADKAELAQSRRMVGT